MKPEPNPIPLADAPPPAREPSAQPQQGGPEPSRFFRTRFDRFLFSAAVALGAGWLLFALSAPKVGRFLAERFGGFIARAGGDKVPDAALFVCGRLHDAFALAALALAFAVVLLWSTRRLQRHAHRPALFVGGGFALFALLNVVVWCAGKRALFWLILLVLSGGTQNNAQFRFKEIVLGEVSVHPSLVLVGSSQSNAQIREERFNQRIAKAGWMVELHFPGSLAEDVFYTVGRFDDRQVDAFVYYVSPLSFYSANTSAIGRDLFRLQDLPAAVRLGTWERFPSDLKRYVALGAALPLFQYREALQRALLGPVYRGPVVQPGVSLHRDASTIRADAASEHQKALFRKLLERIEQKGRRIIVIGGQFNPDAQRHMAPGVAEEYEAFLKACAKNYPGMTLVWQEELLHQPPEAYLDETHVTEETALRFTDRFADWYLSRFAP